MSSRIVAVHTVGRSTVTVKELTGWPEFHIDVDGDRYEVFVGDPRDGQDPDRWYTEVGGVVEGPWDTAEQVIEQAFLTEGAF